MNADFLAHAEELDAKALEWDTKIRKVSGSLPPAALAELEWWVRHYQKLAEDWRRVSAAASERQQQLIDAMR